ncbi:hypothetical protein [Enterococcus faecium]
MSVFELPTVTLIPNGIHHPPIEDGRLLPNSVKGMEAIRGLYKKTRKEGTLFGFSVCTEIKVLLGIPA